MLNKKITDMYEFKIYSGAFKDYFRDRCILSKECVEELEKIENLFFSYNFPIEKIKLFENLLKKDEYIILFSVNVYNNSLNVRIYGKIDMKKIKELREKITSILAKEKYDCSTYNVLRLYENRTVMAIEMHFYSERCTPLLLQRIQDELKDKDYIWKVSRDSPTPMEVIEAINGHSIIVELRTAVINPSTDETKVFITIYGPAGLARKVQKKLNRIMIDFLFVPDEIRTSYAPGTTLRFERQEVVYTNNLTEF
ncbi:MAG: hypothetical protein IKB36_03760 [Clostridia bacterium]|nr:hypothetical protein [Clostridia bacterium]